MAISMFKRATKRIALSMIGFSSLLAPALAQLPETASEGMRQAFEYLGPEGMNFIVAFGIVFAAIYLGLSLIPKFGETDQAKIALGVFAVFSALATAFYVFMNEIDFIGVIAPFSLFVVAILIGLIGIKIIIAVRNEEMDKKTALGAAGFFLLIFGIALAMLTPRLPTGDIAGLAGWGAFLALLGAVFLIISVFLWFRSFRRGQASVKEKEVEETRKTARDLIRQANRLKTIDHIKDENIALLKQMQEYIVEIKNLVGGTRYNEAITVARKLEADIKKFRKDVEKNIKLTKKVKDDIRKELGHIERLEIEGKEGAERYGEHLAEKEEKLVDRIRYLDGLLLKVESYEDALSKRMGLGVKALLKALKTGNYATINAEILEVERRIADLRGETTQEQAVIERMRSFVNTTRYTAQIHYSDEHREEGLAHQIERIDHEIGVEIGKLLRDPSLPAAAKRKLKTVANIMRIAQGEPRKERLERMLHSALVNAEEALEHTPDTKHRQLIRNILAQQHTIEKTLEKEV